jgi:hypothetical protein
MFFTLDLVSLSPSLIDAILTIFVLNLLSRPNEAEIDLCLYAVWEGFLAYLIDGRNLCKCCVFVRKIICQSFAFYYR